MQRRQAGLSGTARCQSPRPARLRPNRQSTPFLCPRWRQPAWPGSRSLRWPGSLPPRSLCPTVSSCTSGAWPVCFCFAPPGAAVCANRWALLPCLRSPRRLTTRSTGPATASRLGRAAPWFILLRTAQAPCRSGPVNSNVRPHEQPPLCPLCRFKRRRSSFASSGRKTRH